MKYHLLKMLGLFFLFSCTGRNSSNQKDTLNNKKTEIAARAKIEKAASIFDTTWFPFSDSSYRLNVHIFNTSTSSQDEINSVITYNYVRNGKTKQIFRDSFFCTDYYIERQDFNNDHVKDILVANYPGGARANPTYHLFLVDKTRHKLTYVKGFEKVLNPGFDTVYNIISSLRLSGKNYYSFYRINAKKRLISLGHGYTDRQDRDTSQYERAVRAIIMDQQKGSDLGRGN